MLPGIIPSLRSTKSGDPLNTVLLHFDGNMIDYAPVDPPHIFYLRANPIIGRASDLTPKFGSGAFAASNAGSCYTPHRADLHPSGDFTIECWSRNGVPATSQALIACKTAANGFGPFLLYLTGNNYVFYASSNGSSWDVSNGQVVDSCTANVWDHLAVTRQGSTFRLFKNGTLTTTFTSSAALIATTSPFVIGTHGLDAGAANQGWIDEVRYSNGVARYTAAFTAPTAPFGPDKVMPSSGNDDFVRQLLHFNGANGAIGILDHAIGDSGKSYIAYNGATISTAQSKFGGASLIQNGSVQFVYTSGADDFNIKNLNFTIDCWVYRTAAANNTRRFVWGHSDGGGASTLTTICEVTAANKLSVTAGQGSASLAIVGTTNITTDTWHHVAMVRDEGTLRLYLDGVQEGTLAITGSINWPNVQFSVGALGSYGGGLQWQGHIDEFRYSVGICRYPGGTTFTPASAAYGPDKKLPTRIFLTTTGAGTWTVPSDWNNANNS